MHRTIFLIALTALSSLALALPLNGNPTIIARDSSDSKLSSITNLISNLESIEAPPRDNDRNSDSDSGSNHGSDSPLNVARSVSSGSGTSPGLSSVDNLVENLESIEAPPRSKQAKGEAEGARALDARQEVESPATILKLAGEGMKAVKASKVLEKVAPETDDLPVLGNGAI